MVDRPRPTGSRSWLPTLLVSLLLAVTLAPLPAMAQPSDDSGWSPPVDAPVLDPFRPPTSAWGSGNRGLAYRTSDGDPVRAVAQGTVSFTGRVGGQLHVTVAHPDGVRSTYAYLASTVVVRGQRIDAGQVLGTATTGFHLTARIGDRYVDPASLLAGSTGVPRLRPEPGAGGGAGRLSQRGGGGGWLGGVLGGVVDGAADVVDGAGGGVAGVLDGAGRGVAGVLDGAGRGVLGVAELAQRAGGGLGASTAGLGTVTVDAAGEVVGAGRAVATVLDAVGPLPPSLLATGALWSTASAGREPARAFLQLIEDLLPSNQALALSGAVLAWHRDGRDCTADDVPVPPGGRGRVLVQVGGLGTSSTGASIAKLDPAEAGYQPQDVVAFSYAGGCTPEPFGLPPTGDWGWSDALAASDYTASDTHQDLELSASRLADLVESVRAVRPDVPIDLAAHSLGGVVARRALEILTERHGGRAPVSVVLTLGSPHQGADLATASNALALDPDLPPLLEELAPDRAEEAAATSVGQLARGTTAQLDPPRPPPDGVRVVSVGAPGDVVVPPERSRWSGATNAVVGPLADVGTGVHGDLPARPEVQRELALALAGLPARCTSFATAVGSAVVGRAIAATEGTLAVAAIVSPWP